MELLFEVKEKTSTFGDTYYLRDDAGRIWFNWVVPGVDKKWHKWCLLNPQHQWTFVTIHNDKLMERIMKHRWLFSSPTFNAENAVYLPI